MHDILHLITFIVVTVLVLSFFGISLPALVHSPVAQENFAYVWHLVTVAWDYLVSRASTLSQQSPLH